MDRIIQANVFEGHHTSAEQWIIELVKQAAERDQELTDLLNATGMTREQLKADIDDGCEELQRTGGTDAKLWI